MKGVDDEMQKSGENRLHGDVQPPAEQGLVPESQGPAVANAVLAGGLDLR